MARRRRAGKSSNNNNTRSQDTIGLANELLARNVGFLVFIAFERR